MGETLQASGIASVLKQVLSGTGIAPWRASTRRNTQSALNKLKSGQSSRSLVLRTMIEQGVLPRLLKTNVREYALDTRPMSLELDKPQNRVFSGSMNESVQSLAKHVAFGQKARAADLINTYRDDGMSAEDLCLDLLQPAARELGQMWVEDRCSFTHVTLGTLSLQSILHDLADEFRRPGHADHNNESALLTTIPGEQHGFGLSMAAEFLRAEGWDVTLESFPSAGDLEEAVGTRPYTLVGVSVGHTKYDGELKALISGIRRNSLNSKIVVSVGGPLFATHPELAASVGADWVASDARQAALKARQLVSET